MKLKKLAVLALPSIHGLRRSSRISMKIPVVTNIALKTVKIVNQIDLKEQKQKSQPVQTQAHLSQIDIPQLKKPQKSSKASKKSRKRLSKKSSQQPSFKTWQHNQLIKQMEQQNDFLRTTITEIIAKYDREREAQEALAQNYRDQQRLLWERLQMMQKNYSGYRSLVGSLQKVVRALKNRLREYDVEIDGGSDVGGGAVVLCNHEE
jgi:coenzyme F420-reducing hydrogenase alpha subunit